MWDKVLLPEHLIGGFRSCGLHPLSREAIPDSKLKTSVPFEAATKEAEMPQLTSGATATNDPAILVTQHIAQYFGNLFIDKQKEKAVKRARTMLRHYGEALTEDEVIDRIRQQEEEKKQKRATKQKKGKAAKKKQDENICQGCDGH